MTLPEFLNALSCVSYVRKESGPKTEKQIVIEMAQEDQEREEEAKRRKQLLESLNG